MIIRVIQQSPIQFATTLLCCCIDIEYAPFVVRRILRIGQQINVHIPGNQRGSAFLDKSRQVPDQTIKSIIGNIAAIQMHVENYNFRNAALAE